MFTSPIFSTSLQNKIDNILKNQTSVSLGRIHFSSPLILAPMSAICNYPFRILMQALGAGGSISELISCHGINYQNEKTLKMLYINKNEKNIGIQLFGEDGDSMAAAAKVAQTYHPNFIDLNLGCPVNKVVKKGGGSALLKDPSKLGLFFRKIKKELDIPLSIKIRTGWSDQNLNALEVEKIAFNEGIEFISIHGRTRNQQYKGLANWQYLEQVAKKSTLPIIGNGDLTDPQMIRNKLEQTHCKALMIGRGALRRPFIFLESIDANNTIFTPSDYLEIIEFYDQLNLKYCSRERHRMIQLKKMSLWFLAGFPGISQFRNELYQIKEIVTVKERISNYLKNLDAEDCITKTIDTKSSFLAGGHG